MTFIYIFLIVLNTFFAITGFIEGSPVAVLNLVAVFACTVAMIITQDD